MIDQDFHKLRERAEKHLSEQGPVTPDDDKLFHDLQVYQLELEMQNDELKNASELLDKERENFSKFFNLAPMGYFILNSASVVMQCNEAGMEMLDIDRTKITNKRFQQFIETDDIPIFLKFLYTLYANTLRENCELKLRTFTGKNLMVRLYGVPVYDGRSFSFFISAVDITQKHEADQKKKEITDRLETALLTSEMGTITICIEKNEANLDHYSEKVMETGSLNEFDGKYSTFLKLIHPKDVGDTDKNIRSLFLQKAPLTIEFRTRSEKPRYIQMRGNLHQLNDNFYFAGVLLNITANRALQLHAQELKINEQKKIMQAIVDAQEKEKARISHSLHDGLAQLLYAANMNLEYSEIHGDFSVIKQARSLLNHAIQETRNISYELAPSILKDHGLGIAIQELLNRIKLPQLIIKFSTLGLKARLQLSSEVFVFRIIQELINNIIKHSEANAASVRLKYSFTKLHIQILDNGKGITMEERNRTSGGLASILNRVKLYDGQFKISNPRSGGTKIEIVIPKIE
jgi:PAS domain S-box-containing protein